MPKISPGFLNSIKASLANPNAGWQCVLAMDSGSPAVVTLVGNNVPAAAGSSIPMSLTFTGGFSYTSAGAFQKFQCQGIMFGGTAWTLFADTALDALITPYVAQFFVQQDALAQTALA